MPDWVPVIEWNAFVDHRKKFKNPLTLYSTDLAIKKLKQIVDAGNKADDIINESILRGWQTFFMPKDYGMSKNETPGWAKGML